MPFMSDPSELPRTLSLAHSRLGSQIRRLQQSPAYLKKYNPAIMNLHQLGFSKRSYRVISQSPHTTFRIMEWWKNKETKKSNVPMTALLSLQDDLTSTRYSTAEQLSYLTRNLNFQSIVKAFSVLGLSAEDTHFLWEVLQDHSWATTSPPAGSLAYFLWNRELPFSFDRNRSLPSHDYGNSYRLLHKYIYIYLFI